MDILTEGLEGVANIADDLAVAGKNQKDHDKKLIKLMKRNNFQSNFAQQARINDFYIDDLLWL